MYVNRGGHHTRQSRSTHVVAGELEYGRCARRQRRGGGTAVLARLEQQRRLRRARVAAVHDSDLSRGARQRVHAVAPGDVAAYPVVGEHAAGEREDGEGGEGGLEGDHGVGRWVDRRR
jgi:hypothetical protein